MREVFWWGSRHTDVETVRIKIVEGSAPKDIIRTYTFGRLRRRVLSDAIEVDREPFFGDGRGSHFMKVIVDDEMRIRVESRIGTTGPKQVAVNYDECGKLVGIDFGVFSEPLGAYMLCCQQEETEDSSLRALGFQQKGGQKLLEREVSWGDVLRFDGYEYLIEKVVDGQIWVPVSKDPRFPEFKFRVTIDNERIFRLIESEKPKAWQQVFMLV